MSTMDLHLTKSKYIEILEGLIARNESVTLKATDLKDIIDSNINLLKSNDKLLNTNTHIVKKTGSIITDLAKAVDIAYRKHVLDDSFLGCSEVSEILSTALANFAGYEIYSNWLADYVDGAGGLVDYFNNVIDQKEIN